MVNTRKKFRENELALASAVKEIVTCWRSSSLNKSDQVISLSPSDGWVERAPGPSSKLQAPSSASFKQQASSPDQQASSFKPQASSSVIREPRNI